MYEVSFKFKQIKHARVEISGRIKFSATKQILIQLCIKHNSDFGKLAFN